MIGDESTSTQPFPLVVEANGLAVDGTISMVHYYYLLLLVVLVLLVQVLIPPPATTTNTIILHILIIVQTSTNATIYKRYLALLSPVPPPPGGFEQRSPSGRCSLPHNHRHLPLQHFSQAKISLAW